MLFEGEDSEIDLDQPEPEFSAFEWVDIHQLPLHVRSCRFHLILLSRRSHKPSVKSQAKTTC